MITEVRVEFLCASIATELADHLLDRDTATAWARFGGNVLVFNVGAPMPAWMYSRTCNTY